MLAIWGHAWYYVLARYERVYALVAQLDRVTGYEPVGRGFESLPAYQKRGMFFRMFLVFIMLWKCARILFISGSPQSQRLCGERRNIRSVCYDFALQNCLNTECVSTRRTTVRQILRGETYGVIVGKCLHFALITECVSTSGPFDTEWRDRQRTP